MSSDSQRMPLLLTLYEQYLENQDSATFLRKVSWAYTQGTLQRLARHEACKVRRGAVLALGLLGDYEANQTLGHALQDADRTVRTLAETGIRNVWLRVGSDQQRQQLSILVRLNASQRYQDVIQKASDMIDKAPWLAEAWNQRAIAHFALSRFTDSIRDAHQALEINPYHFAAASGMGQAYLQLKSPTLALECFRRALGLNRDLEGVRAQVERLTRSLKDK